jgi:hypothetical protein
MPDFQSFQGLDVKNTHQIKKGNTLHEENKV